MPEHSYSKEEIAVFYAGFHIIADAIKALQERLEPFRSTGATGDELREALSDLIGSIKLPDGFAMKVHGLALALLGDIYPSLDFDVDA